MKKHRFSTTKMIIFGFFTAIVIGTLLLSLPIAAKAGKEASLIDTVFMATTSVCVTGLTTVNVVEQWSFFGQLVILLLMQFGGLGIITFTTTILLVFGKRITLKDRLLIQEAYNIDTMSGLVRLTKRILKGTFVVELFGAVVYFICIFRSYSLGDSIWKAIFLSVSAFCNAGMDLFGADSLSAFRGDWLMNLNTMLLIILGGLGFPVWWSFIEVLSKTTRGSIRKTDFLRKLSIHSKLVIMMTGLLIISGAVLTLLMEYSNPATLKELPFSEKLLASFFQSVTTRTAGFYTIPQESFRESTGILYLLLMFIGGSPCGTAGGIKTVTFFVMLLSTIAIIKGRRDTDVFNRRITDFYLRKALAVTMISMGTLLLAFFALSVVQKGSFLDMLYEATSALATVGLTRNVTGSLNFFGKLIIILCMYLGRVGPISMALALNSRKNVIAGQLPEGHIYVG